MKLYGTTTSPFVRRVRIVAAEVGATLEWINTAPDEGQAAMRKVSPIWKVPVAEVGDRVLYDSRVIIEWLTTFHGWCDLRAPGDPWREANLVNAIDGALESAIQLFYLRREGIDVSGTSFSKHQVERMDAIFTWLSTELGQEGFGTGLGVAEISLCATLDWMDFRETYPTAKLEGPIAALRAAYRERPSLVETRPFVS